MLKNESEIIIKLKKALIDKRISQLQHDVYKFLLTIPPGKVSTYKEISKHLKCNSPRAIGQALRKNPFAPEIPCHRVVNTSLKLGGFCGSTSDKTVENKMKLLMDEGVKFQPPKEELSLCLSEIMVAKEHVWMR